MADERTQGTSGLEEQRQIRIGKLEALRAEGTLPYAERFERSHTLAQAREIAVAQTSDEPSDGTPVTTAGRVMTVRQFGKLLFFHLQDGSGRCQVAIDGGTSGQDVIERFQKFVDLGDHIGVQGATGRTRKGEPTVWATSFTMLSKTLRPLPEKWKGLGDLETRQRERYLDLVSNPETRARFKLRTRFLNVMRYFLDSHGFEEVDTPILQTKATGALAKPFFSHHNALDMQVVLRIAPETWLKQCVAGGMDRVYEVARCFRNEGMDPSHLQDFTMVEWYAAYWNYEDNMDFTQELVLYLLDEVLGARSVTVGDHTIDFAPPWPRVSMHELVLRDSGIDYEQHPTADDLRAAIRAKGIQLEREDLDKLGRGTLIDVLYKKVSRPKLINPTFVIDHPIDLSPLARRSDDNPNRTDRYQLLVNTWEVVNAYSELVDPMDQRARFEAQAAARAAGDDEALEVDEDYLRCMEHGMPPMSGWGMGVERFLALLTGQENLREVVLFPLMKPLGKEPATEAKADGAPEADDGEEHLADEFQDLLGHPADDVDDIGMTMAQARALFDEWVTSPSLRRQMEETSVVMGALAQARGANEEAWKIIGLMHNLDFDRHKEPENHTLIAAKVLKDAGMHPAGIHAIAAHNDKNLTRTGIRCISALDHAVSACEAVVGLIHAAIQILPSKSVKDLKVKSLEKRFKNAKFAANVERDLIERCAGLGLERKAFFELVIGALAEAEVA